MDALSQSFKVLNVPQNRILLISFDIAIIFNV